MEAPASPVESDLATRPSNGKVASATNAREGHFARAGFEARPSSRRSQVRVSKCYRAAQVGGSLRPLGSTRRPPCWTFLDWFSVPNPNLKLDVDRFA